MTVDRAGVPSHLCVGPQLVAQGLPEVPIPYFRSTASGAFSAGSYATCPDTWSERALNSQGRVKEQCDDLTFVILGIEEMVTAIQVQAC